MAKEVIIYIKTDIKSLPEESGIYYTDIGSRLFDMSDSGNGWHWGEQDIKGRFWFKPIQLPL